MKFVIPLLIFCMQVVAKNSSLDQPKKYIAVLVRPDYRGEISFAHRIQFACKNLGWRADVVDITHAKDLKTKPCDFVINLVPGVYKHPKCKNYMAIFHPLHHYFDKKGFIKKKYRDYDGYLLTYSPWINDKNFKGKKLPYIKWYPTVHRQEYRQVDPKYLFYLCCAWGNRAEDTKFQQFLGLLDKENFMRFYGSSFFQEYYPLSYQASIPYDQDILCEIASRSGVALVLHSSDHNDCGLPSGRIFEAAAASTMIICDENTFVREHFGDSVLYIDTDADAESVFNQVMDHMQWIQSNQAMALEKAKKAHAIYRQHFLLENQLLRLGEFHDLIPKHTFSKWLKKIGGALNSWRRSNASLMNPTPLTMLPNVDDRYSLINSVDFHPKKNLFCMTYTHNNKIVFYEIDVNHEPRFFQSFHNPAAKLSEPQHAVFSPDGDKLFVANWTNQTINIYQCENNGYFSEEPMAIIPAPKELERCKPHGIAFSPCGNYLAIAYGASSRYEQAIALFQYKEPHLECISILKNAQLPGNPKGITFSPDGTCLLVTFCDLNSLVVFEVQDQKICPTPKQTMQGLNTRISRPEDIKFASNGCYCAVSNSDQNCISFYIFDQKSNSILHNTPFYVLENSENPFLFPHGIAFSPDGSYFLLTEFGQIHTTEEGDISWNQEQLSSEAKVRLYLLGGI